MKKILLSSILIFTTIIMSGCVTIPTSKNIDVPFTSQAPAGNWSEPWKNACEETSLYMVSNFYADNEIKKEEAIKRIKEIIATKNKEFNISADESLEKISELIKLLGLPWKTEIVVNPSLDDIKQQLAINQPIIAPVFGPALKNLADGPDYHVMVITGYDDKTNEFIVNDPAMENGKGVRFDYSLFMNAIHDLNSQNYRAGQKALLFTKPAEDVWWF